MTTTLTIKRTDLRSAVSYILPATSPSVLPVLKHLEMRFDPNQKQIELNATDIEIRMQISLPAQIEFKGEATQSCLIPAQTFVDILGMLEGEKVRLEITDYELLTHAGSSKNRLSLSTEDSFPPELTLASNASLLSLFTQDLKHALQRVISAAGTDYSRPVLNTICFDLKGGNLRLVAADGFRLAVDMVVAENAVEEERQFLMPLKTAQKLLRSLPNEDQPLSIQADGAYMLIRWGENHFWASLIDGDFPDWRQIVYMPDGFTLPGDARPFPREGLEMAVKRAEIFARDGSIPHLIRFRPSEGGMCIRGEGDHIGHSEEEVDCTIHLPFNLNGLYLLQALAGMTLAFPHLYLTGSAKPIIFAEEDFIYVIMPLTILDESPPVKQAEEAVPV
jgi:DNA polymerase-3 subunit beta